MGIATTGSSAVRGALLLGGGLIGQMEDTRGQQTNGKGHSDTAGT
jgi:hypothetical protein